MKLGVLTSSRADYGIYLPLLNKLKSDGYFELEIISFGMHLCEKHGNTIRDIENDSYKTIHKVCDLDDKDDELAISKSYANTILKFAEFWNDNYFDLVICLGDRFEMNAAVQASIPYGVKLAHIHGGEETLGAIDNIYRHQISLASQLHFTTTESHSVRVSQLTGFDSRIYNVGSMSLDGIENFNPVNRQELLDSFNIKDEPYALCTFHPETVNSKNNIRLAEIMKSALNELCRSINIVITLPNADTLGSVFREASSQLKKANPENIFLVENFGKTYYFSAMYHSEYLIGNTSSGIIEAASFGKYVVNVGNRQEGRVQSSNILNSGFIHEDIIEKARIARARGRFNGVNVYHKSGTVTEIINRIKQFNDKF